MTISANILAETELETPRQLDSGGQRKAMKLLEEDKNAEVPEGTDEEHQ